MKVLIDTNVIMDALVGREPFFEKSQYVVNLCGDRIIIGCLAAHTITNLFYILRKYFDSDKCRDMLLDLFVVFQIGEIDTEKLINALNNRDFKDFEDCLQMECGCSLEADYIVTRDVKDFASSTIPCITPDELWQRFNPVETKE